MTDQPAPRPEALPVSPGSAAASPSAQPKTPAAPSSRRGLFIALEGGDGSGKSTQARLLAESLRADGVDVDLTREPGGTPIGERVRGLVLDPEHAPVDPVTEALLFAAARSAHVRRRILPALAAGTTVITDRYMDSSIAYQGAGRDLGTDTIAELNHWATGGLTPDLTVLLDADTTTAAARRTQRESGTAGGTVGTAPGAGPDRIESEPAAFHERIRAAFLERASSGPGRSVVLDASRPADELAAQIRAHVGSLLASSPAPAADRDGGRA